MAFHVRMSVVVWVDWWELVCARVCVCARTRVGEWDVYACVRSRVRSRVRRRITVPDCGLTRMRMLCTCLYVRALCTSETVYMQNFSVHTRSVRATLAWCGVRDAGVGTCVARVVSNHCIPPHTRGPLAALAP